MSYVPYPRGTRRTRHHTLGKGMRLRFTSQVYPVYPTARTAVFQTSNYDPIGRPVKLDKMSSFIFLYALI